MALFSKTIKNEPIAPTSPQPKITTPATSTSTTGGMTSVVKALGKPTTTSTSTTNGSTSASSPWDTSAGNTNVSTNSGNSTSRARRTTTISSNPTSSTSGTMSKSVATAGIPPQEAPGNRGNTTPASQNVGSVGVNRSGIDPSTQVGVPSGIYQVQANGKAPVGLAVGDQVVTGGGTFQITGVNADGTYQSTRVSDTNTGNFKGQYSATTTRPDGVTQKAFDYAYDPTDYASRMTGSQTSDEFSHNAQQRVNQASAQGRDISGNGIEKSNAELYQDWWNTTGSKTPVQYTGSDGQLHRGYYGMDGSGNWGYYDDPGMTQKSANGNWTDYKASDGGYAHFTTDRGYLWPSTEQDPSRAGQTVTLVGGSKAFQVTYDRNGKVSSVLNLSATRGIDGRTLDLPTAKSLNDRGVNGPELLRQSNGISYAGAESGISQANLRGAMRDDYAALMGTPNEATPVSTTPANLPTGTTTTGYGGQPGYTQTGSVNSYPWGNIQGNTGSPYSPGIPGTYPTGTPGSTPAPGSTPTPDSTAPGTPAPTETQQTTETPGGEPQDWKSGSLEDELKELYNGQDSAYMQALEDLRAANEAAVQRATSSLEDQKRSADLSYADLFRQLYIDRMNNQRDIDQRMAAQGITGGAAESTLLGLGTQYEDALRRGEQERLNTIYGLDRAIEDARLSGDISAAEAAANLARENVNSYADVLRNLIAQRNTDRAYNYQLARDAVGDSQWAQQFNLQKQQAAANVSATQARAAASAASSAASSQLAAQKWAYQQQLDLAKLAAQYGDYSGLNNMGIDTTSYAEKLAEQANAYKPQFTVSQVNNAIKDNNLTSEILRAYEYYYGEPYSGKTETAYTPQFTISQVNSAVSGNNLTPEILRAYEYYYGAPYSAPQTVYTPKFTISQVNNAIKNNTMTKEILDAYEYYYGVPYGSAGTSTYTGYSANGTTYPIGSTRGIEFITNNKSYPAGAQMTGGDGSTWVKNADGSVTITKNGTVYKVG